MALGKRLVSTTPSSPTINHSTSSTIGCASSNGQGPFVGPNGHIMVGRIQRIYDRGGFQVSECQARFGNCIDMSKYR
jgi:hypothetical protein